MKRHRSNPNAAGLASRGATYAMPPSIPSVLGRADIKSDFLAIEARRDGLRRYREQRRAVTLPTLKFMENASQ